MVFAQPPERRGQAVAQPALRRAMRVFMGLVSLAGGGSELAEELRGDKRDGSDGGKRHQDGDPMSHRSFLSHEVTMSIRTGGRRTLLACDPPRRTSGRRLCNQRGILRRRSSSSQRIMVPETLRDMVNGG